MYSLKLKILSFLSPDGSEQEFPLISCNLFLRQNLPWDRVQKAHSLGSKAQVKRAREEAAKKHPKVRVFGHLACEKGRLTARRWEAYNAEETSYCYADCDRGVACHHIEFVTRDPAYKIKARNLVQLRHGK